MDERTVPDPAALAAGVDDSWAHAEVLGDLAHRPVHGRYLIRSEVVDLHAGSRHPPGEELDRLDAVAHVEVRLSLLAIAEDGQGGRVAAQRAVKVEKVAVRIAFA